jgi:hypothetical protein
MTPLDQRNIERTDLFGEVVPLEALEVLEVPHVVVVIIALPAADLLGVQHLGHAARDLLVLKLDPALRVLGLAVATGSCALLLMHLVLGDEVDAVDVAILGQQVLQLFRLHVGRNAADVHDAAFGSARAILLKLVLRQRRGRCRVLSLRRIRFCICGRQLKPRVRGGRRGVGLVLVVAHVEWFSNLF